MNYLIYTCTLTQSSSSDPVVDVLENQLHGTVEWTANGNGNVIGTLTGAFPQGKTHILFMTDASNGPMYMSCSREDNDRVSVVTYDASLAAQDGFLNNTLIEIRVYY